MRQRKHVSRCGVALMVPDSVRAAPGHKRWLPPSHASSHPGTSIFGLCVASRGTPLTKDETGAAPAEMPPPAAARAAPSYAPGLR